MDTGRKSGNRMPSFNVGDYIALDCEVQPGPFDEERLVTIETVDGMISGFIRRSELREDNGRWQVRGKVRSFTPNSIEVLIRGSFFTTNGIANVPPHIAATAA